MYHVLDENSNVKQNLFISTAKSRTHIAVWGADNVIFRYGRKLRTSTLYSRLEKDAYFGHYMGYERPLFFINSSNEQLGSFSSTDSHYDCMKHFHSLRVTSIIHFYWLSHSPRLNGFKKTSFHGCPFHHYRQDPFILQGLNLSAETRTSGLFWEFLVIPETSVNQMRIKNCHMHIAF